VVEDDSRMPTSPYGLSKLASEELVGLYAREYAVPVTILRYFTVYGPRQRPEMDLSRFIYLATRGEPIKIFGDGTQSREMAYLSDVAGATVAALEAKPERVIRVYNVGGGTRTTVGDVVELVGEMMGERMRIRYAPPGPGTCVLPGRTSNEQRGSWTTGRGSPSKRAWRRRFAGRSRGAPCEGRRASFEDTVEGVGMIGTLLIPVFVYLPGHFLGAFLLRKGDGWAELALLRVACAAAISTPVLVALALLGRFEVPVVLGALGVCAVVAWTFSRRGEGRARPMRWDLGALGLVAGAFALYAHPAEYVLKDRDPGVYTVAAAKLARTGELLTWDPLVGRVASFHEFEHGAKHLGFYIHGVDLVVPQFFPGPFAWLGVGNLAGDVWGELYVVPVFGALAVGMAFVLGGELFGRWTGFVGAALLAVSYVQVWWARYPSSEIMTQFFVLAGLWFAARFVRDGGAGTGVLAGALLSGAMMIRVDAFLSVLVIPAMILHDVLLGRSPRRWVYLCSPLLLAGGAMLLYAGTVGERYLNLIYDLHVPENVLRLSPYLLGGALLAAGAALMLHRLWSGGYESLLALHGQRAALLAALAVMGAALWAYFVLPEPWEGLPQYWGGDGSMAGFNAYDRQVAVRMVWFLTPALAVLGVVGFVWAAYRLDAARALFLGAFLAFGLLYVALPNVAPDLPWATRRFIPVVFPGLCLLAGYAIVEAGRSLGKVWSERVGASCAAALAVSAFVWSVYVAWPVYGMRELAGAVEGIERLEESVPDSRVVYVELPGDDYAATLDYLYGRPVLAYERDQFRREVPDLREAGLLEDAVYVTVEEKHKPVFQGLRLREVEREEVSFLRLEDGFKDIPRDTYEERQGFRIYELEQT
jgi:hypothetical protein